MAICLAAAGRYDSMIQLYRRSGKYFSRIPPIPEIPDKRPVRWRKTEEKQNKGILITDHLYRDILDISDKLYVLSDGRTRPAKGTEDLESFGCILAS